MDLFSQAPQNEPLAARMRPRNLDEYIGQEHIVGKGRLLRRAIQADQLSSLIFYGPPGTGKTTLARVIAGTTSSRFISINAVLSGVKQIREAIDEAQETRDLHGRRSILFVDEVHRWNKAQQDALLPWVENGTLILIGATTENPYFEVNSALVSRSRLFQLKELGPKDLEEIALQALKDSTRGYGRWKVTFEEGALEHLIKTADGDARSVLNSLQLAVETTPASFPPPENSIIHITLETAEESIQQKAVLYDKEGDYHYDTISAFIKSIRGSDPDAALYWMARMVRAGEDPRFIFRRMIISASEDVGMADPNALVVVNAAAQAFDRIGLPEGQFPLTQAALYLATAPKSNSAMAFFDALKTVEEEAAKEVPNHLKDPSRDKHGFGHGEGYNYPHAYREHWVAQAYLPEGLKGRIFYQPSAQGYEKQIQEGVMRNREAQMAAMIEEPVEVLTFSPGGKQREAWIRRTKGETGRFLETLRDSLFAGLKTERHHRILIWLETSGLLLWEAWRKVPEGGVCARFPRQRDLALCEHFIRSLPESERPFLIDGEKENNIQEQLEQKFGRFESILTRDWIRSVPPEAWLMEWEMLTGLIKKPGGRIVCGEPLPAGSSRLTDFLDRGAEDLSFWEDLLKQEEQIYRSRWKDLESLESLEAFFLSHGAPSAKGEEMYDREERFLGADQLSRWLDISREGSFGNLLSLTLKTEQIREFCAYCLEHLSNQKVPWKTAYAAVTLKF